MPTCPGCGRKWWLTPNTGVCSDCTLLLWMGVEVKGALVGPARGEIVFVPNRRKR